MRQLPEATERMLKHIEEANGGWLYGGKVPLRLRVILDGRTVDKVTAVNRSEGVVELPVEPCQIAYRDGNPELLKRTLRGSVELEVLK